MYEIVFYLMIGVLLLVVTTVHAMDEMKEIKKEEGKEFYLNFFWWCILWCALWPAMLIILAIIAYDEE